MAIILLRSTLAFAKESVGVLGYVGSLFTSGFTRGTPPPEPAGWVVQLPQFGLALLFTGMLVSVFLPGTKILAHTVAACAAIAFLWYFRMIWTGFKMEILCFPALLFWFFYYAISIFAVTKTSLPERP